MLRAAQKFRTQTIPELISRGIWAGIGFAIPDRMASNSSRIGVVTEVEAEVLIRDAAEVGRMINGLVRSLERSR